MGFVAMNRLCIGAAGALLAFSCSPSAADSNDSGFGLGIGAGTLGAGVSIVKSIVSHRLTAELDLNAPLRLSYTTDASGTHYSGKLRTEAPGVLLNFFPSDVHLFHVSAGAYYDDNRVDLGAQFAPGAFTLNGRHYTSSELTSLSDRVTFRRVAPYLGLGWGDGTASTGWHFNANAGVLYQGSARVDLIGTTPYLTGSPQYDALFASLDGQRSAIGDALDQHLKWYPVLSVQLLYCF
jgi:hypothetical protein